MSTLAQKLDLYTPYDLPPVIRLSHSTMSLYDSCPRKFELGKLFRHPRDNESFHGATGHALHAGHQEWLKSGDEEKSIMAMILEYPIEMEANPNAPKSLEACYATLMAMNSSHLLAGFELATVRLENGDIVPAIEVPFEISLKGFTIGGSRVIYVGFMDMILFNQMTGEYVVCDIKTNRERVDDLTPKYAYDEQTLPYALVLNKLLGISIESLDVKYMDVFVDIKEPKVKMYNFPKSPIDIEDWAKGFLDRVMDIKRSVERGWFRRQTGSCMAYNRPCSYFDVCQSRDHKVIQNMIMVAGNPYVEKEIIPWAKIELELGL